MKIISVELQEVALAGAIGMVLQMLMKAKSIQDKARKGNIQFKFMEYFTADWLSHLISTLAIILFLILVRRRLDQIPSSMYEIVLAFGATVGYMGADIVSRFFSATNKKVNDALDFKTDIADKASGTLGTPTPK